MSLAIKYMFKRLFLLYIALPCAITKDSVQECGHI